jgi:hypothetical protein
VVKAVAATPDDEKFFSKLARGCPTRKKNEAGETTSAPMFFHAN